MDLDRLDALLADAAAEMAGAERSSTRMLREAAEQEATFVGALVDVAERGDVVVVRTTGGRPQRGRIQAVGRDFCVVRDRDNPPVLIALAAVASVRVTGRARHDTSGQRRPPVAASLQAMLSRLAAERPLVQVWLAGEDGALLATLRSVGADVVTLRLEAEARSIVLVAVAAVSEVVLLER